jgi:hypothetical protein
MGGNVPEWTVEIGADGREAAVVQGGGYASAERSSEFLCAQRGHPATTGGNDRYADAGIRLARDVPAPDLAEFSR